ncbi:hypothetical protein E2C01_015054 [Portunus trituberculatus]|uniref:Uncharacterized protein n=1 Tax=Portunus trituberculatus TaxID=210409 RepID=A0A5B7DLT5_PORTR|nr:hypothetical protein [Portunus trituberculatus]
MAVVVVASREPIDKRGFTHVTSNQLSVVKELRRESLEKRRAGGMRILGRNLIAAARHSSDGKW